METIEVDNDVFTYLQKHARPFVDSPNSTLRRLLGIDGTESPVQQKTSKAPEVLINELVSESIAVRSLRTKAPKADVGLLIQHGLLRNGQRLHLVDYQGNRVQKFSAAISGSDLFYNGQRYSMSSLAQELLAQVGFKSSAVRGPAHWLTEDGESIKDLWQKYLTKVAKK